MDENENLEEMKAESVRSIVKGPYETSFVLGILSLVFSVVGCVPLAIAGLVLASIGLSAHNKRVKEGLDGSYRVASLILNILGIVLSSLHIVLGFALLFAINDLLYIASTMMRFGRYMYF